MVARMRRVGKVPPSEERSLVSDRVFRSLSEDVLSGRYAPGEKLPTQRRIAADLGVNMASVREAVKRLEQLRLVDVRHGDAMRVTDWRTHGGLDVIAALLARAGEVERGALNAILEARRLMLFAVGGLAAQRRTDEQAARLRELAARMGEVTDQEAAQSVDFAFMSDLVEAADNLVLVLVMNSIRVIYFERPTLFAAVVREHAELVPLYRRIADAVEQKDPGLAAAAVGELAAAQEARVLSSVPS